jgi:hypothetical protein
MSVGASQVHQATINSQGKLEFSRDANRDLNFTWHLGLQLAVALNIQNYSGVILANRKQHLPSTINAKWQHVFVWVHGTPQDYQQRRMKGNWITDVFKLHNNTNSCCIALLECDHEMPLEEPLIKSMQDMLNQGTEIMKDSSSTTPSQQQPSTLQTVGSKSVRFDKETTMTPPTAVSNSSSSSSSTSGNFRQNVQKHIDELKLRVTSGSFKTPSSGQISLDSETVTWPSTDSHISKIPSQGSDHQSQHESTPWDSAKSLKTEPDEECDTRPVGLPGVPLLPLRDAHAGQDEPLHESQTFNRPRLADRNRINSPRAHQFYGETMPPAVEYQHYIDYVNQDCFRVAVDTTNDSENLDVVIELQYAHDLETFAVQKELRPLTPEEL